MKLCLYLWYLMASMMVLTPIVIPRVLQSLVPSTIEPIRVMMYSFAKKGIFSKPILTVLYFGNILFWLAFTGVMVGSEPILLISAVGLMAVHFLVFTMTFLLPVWVGRVEVNAISSSR